MGHVLLPGLCLLSFTWTTVGLQASAAHVLAFAVVGDSVALPCAIPSMRHCSSVDWNVAGEFQSFTAVVQAGTVTSPRHVLLRDCSLQINQLLIDDARLYSCVSGTRNASVSLQFLDITENMAPEKGKIELQCFLNTYKGHTACNDTGIDLTWTTEDNTPIHGNRFDFKHPSKCFSKLIINTKPTDHYRKWKCQLTQDDVVKASVSYTTTVPDGVEEVFSAVGESVSLSCNHTSSLGVSVMWVTGEKREISRDKGESEPFHVNQDSSLAVNQVSAQHGGEYQCSESTHKEKVLNKIRLHVLDVISEHAPGQDNLTLICVLTCANQCEKDFNLTWSGRSHNSWQSGLMQVNNTLTNKLVLSVGSVRSEEIRCSVHREDAVMASKAWHHSSPLQTLAWLGLPLGLLTSAAAGGVYTYKKRKRNHDAGNQQTSFGMSHVYEVVDDVNNEELQQHREIRSKREAAATDGFYHLLQAANQN